MQYQAALQLSQQAPQLYDMGKLHRQMLEVLGIQDASDIIKLPDDIKLHSLKLEETETSYSEWFAADN